MPSYQPLCFFAGMDVPERPGANWSAHRGGKVREVRVEATEGGYVVTSDGARLSSTAGQTRGQAWKQFRSMVAGGPSPMPRQIRRVKGTPMPRAARQEGQTVAKPHIPSHPLRRRVSYRLQSRKRVRIASPEVTSINGESVGGVGAHSHSSTS